MVEMNAEHATRAQADMWLAQNLQSEVRNNLVTCWDVDGPIDTAILDEAHRIVLDECPDLQVSFEEGPRGLELVRHKQDNLPSRHFDVSSFASPEKRAIDLVALVTRDPFDLKQSRLYRMGSIKLAEGRFMVFMVFHHIVTDAVGLLSYCHRVADVYNDLSAQEPIRPWPQGAPSQIAQQERGYLASSRYEDDLEFWAHYLADYAPVPILDDINLAEDLPVAANPMALVADAVGMSSVAIDLPRPEIEKLEYAASSLEIKVPSLLIGAAAIAFRRLCSSQKLTFSIAVANRRGRVRLAPGLAANSIPIRVNVGNEQSLAEVVTTIASELPSLYRHSSAPIGEIRRRNFPPSQDRSPAGPVLSFIPVINKIAFADSAARLYGGCFANLDELMISFYDNGDESGLSVSFDAPTDLYTRIQLRSIATALLAAVRDLADDPTALVDAARTASSPTARQATLATSSTATGRPPYRAPRNPQEEHLSRAFADTLGVEEIGIDDDFFQLGGNSLLAISLIAKLRKELDSEVAIRDLFQAPTIAMLVERGSAGAASARPTLRRMT